MDSGFHGTVRVSVRRGRRIALVSLAEDRFLEMLCAGDAELCAGRIIKGIGLDFSSFDGAGGLS